MRKNLGLATLERSVIRDANLFFTTSSILMVLVIFLNLSSVSSVVIGALASIAYLVVNSIFLGHALFPDEDGFLRFMLGSLTLILVIGLASWAMMIIYNLDILRSTIVLASVTILSSLLNRRASHRVKQNLPTLSKVEETKADEKLTHKRLLRIAEVLYLFMAVLLLYLLFSSRSGEVSTVWQVLPLISVRLSAGFLLVLPSLFLLAFFISTFLLLVITFSGEETHYKLVFVIFHSLVSHSLFTLLFPAGDIGVQQVILGTTRRIFENTTLHGYGHSANVLVQIYYWMTGVNFQSACSVIFARMLSVDVFWSHLVLVPLLWGTFAPIIVFMITRTIGGSKVISALSSLAISAFPATLYWGAFSVPNNLGFFFALCSLYFILKYLSSNQKLSYILVLAFSLASLISHYLTGVIVFSLLLLAAAFKNYDREKYRSPMVTKYMLVISFVLSVSLLPMALTYHRFLSPMYALFSLDRLSALSPIELVGSFVMGEYFFYSPVNMAVNVAAPLLGFVGLVLAFRATVRKKESNNFRLCLLFLVSGFLLMFLTYRILKFFMVGVPFTAERVWILRDFILTPYLAIVGLSVLLFLLYRRKPDTLSQAFTPAVSFEFFSKVTLKRVLVYALVLISLSGWITASLYYAYPHFAPLQTTSYEIEAVKYMKANTRERYVVIADQWIIFAGQMFVGVYNPRAYYFAHTDPKGVRLFLDMKNNTSVDTMIEAMKVNNATVAYFVIVKPRLGAETYSHIIQQAQQNNLRTYKIFYYPAGEEKLRIFCYKSP